MAYSSYATQQLNCFIPKVLWALEIIILKASCNQLHIHNPLYFSLILFIPYPYHAQTPPPPIHPQQQSLPESRTAPRMCRSNAVTLSPLTSTLLGSLSLLSLGTKTLSSWKPPKDSPQKRHEKRPSWSSLRPWWKTLATMWWSLRTSLLEMNSKSALQL